MTNNILIKVKVKAGANKEKVTATKNGFNIDVKEEAQGNEANKRVLEIISTKFPNSKPKIIKGHHRPSKIISVTI